MDYTSQMTSLLSELRRERNGAAADAMSFYGKRCGLNLGVALHTIRTIIADIPRNDDFARLLFRQDVRELKIAALWLAEPDRVDAAHTDVWQQGIINSEIAEQAAMALFSRVGCIDDIIERWTAFEDALPVYTALLSAARSPRCDAGRTLAAIEGVVDRFTDHRLVAQGIVAAMTALCERAPEAVTALYERIKQKKTPAATFISDELSWRLCESENADY